MIVIVAPESAGVLAPFVRDGSIRTVVRGYDPQIEIHHAHSGDIARRCAHAMCCMTDRARKPGIDVNRVFAKTDIRHHVAKVVTLGTQGIRPSRRRINNRREKILDGRSRSGEGRQAQCHLAELVATLQDVRELGTVRPVWASAAEFAVVIAIVAIGAEEACAHWPPLGVSIQIQQVLTQAGLWERTVAVVHDRMARCCRRVELRGYIQRVSRVSRSCRQVAENGGTQLPRAGGVATQADLILTCRWIHDRRPVHRAHSDDALL